MNCDKESISIKYRSDDTYILTINDQIGINNVCFKSKLSWFCFLIELSN